MGERTDLVVLRLREVIRGHDTPTIRTYPELRMHFVFRNDLASQNVAHEQVIVHRLRDYLCDGRRCKLDEPVEFRPTGLHASLSNEPDRYLGRRTLLFCESRRRDISPNWEKYARN